MRAYCTPKCAQAWGLFCATESNAFDLHMAGADFVKTSTGFSTGGATVEHITLMRQTVGPDVGVKASGGIRDYATAQAMVDAGYVSRLYDAVLTLFCAQWLSLCTALDVHDMVLTRYLPAPMQCPYNARSALLAGSQCADVALRKLGFVALRDGHAFQHTTIQAVVPCAKGIILLTIMACRALSRCVIRRPFFWPGLLLLELKTWLTLPLATPQRQPPRVQLGQGDCRRRLGRWLWLLDPYSNTKSPECTSFSYCPSWAHRIACAPARQGY
jgi:hypothetical protein